MWRVRSSRVHPIEHPIATVCDTSKHPTLVYHVVGSDNVFGPSRGASRNFEYRPYKDDPATWKNIASELAREGSCRRRILIVASSTGPRGNNAYIALNAILASLVYPMPNLSIIHETDSFDKVVFAPYRSGKLLVHKAVNAYYNAELLNTATRDYTSRIELPMPHNADGVTAPAFVRLMDTSAGYDDDPEHWWWARWFLSVPHCAFGRLKQTTGTCWFNPCLNALLLSPMLSKMVAAEFAELPDALKQHYMSRSLVRSCPRGSVLDMVFRVYANVILQRHRPEYGQNVSTPAAMTLVDAGRGRRGTPQLTKYDDVKDDLLKMAMTTLCISVFGDVRVMWLQLSPSMPTCEGAFALADADQLAEADIVVITQLTPYSFPRTTDSIKDHMAFNMLHKPHPSRSIGDFSLDAGIIWIVWVEDGEVIPHAAAGLICDGVPYIYDSANTITSDDWSTGQYEAYVDDVRRTRNLPEVLSTYTDTVVYVRRTQRP